MASPQTKEQREKTTEKLRMFSNIVSLVAESLQGVADATKKCADNPGPPRCSIEPRGGKRMKGGAKQNIKNPRKSGNLTLENAGNAITGPNSSGAEAVEIAEKVSSIVLGMVFGAINDYIVPLVEKQIFGGDINSLSAEELTSNLQAKTKNIQRILNDPKMQEAIKELVMAYTTLIIQIIEIAQPSIDIITDEVWETISETANRSVIGAISTTLNLTEAAVGEIPVAGGVIDLIIAITRATNRLVKAVVPALSFGATTLSTSIDTGTKFAKAIQDGHRQIEEATKSFNQLTNDPVGAVASRVNDKVSAAEAAGNAAIARAASKPAAAVRSATSRVNKASDAATGAVVKKATPPVIRPGIKPRVPGIRPRVPPRTGGGGKKKRINVRATKKRNKNKNKNMKKMKRVTMRRRK
jgi:hypothetical protein